MDTVRRIFCGLSLAACFMPATSMASPTTTQPPPDESDMITYMKDHGVDHFIMLNKKRGQILFVVNNAITETVPALTGRKKGDAHTANLGVTPSGIFVLQSFGDNESIGFKWVDGTNFVYAIHTVLDVKGQKRPERLKSLHPEWQRISSGCVNVSQDSIYKIQGLMTMPQAFKTNVEGQYTLGSFFVVLPETQPVRSIFKNPEFHVR